MISFAEADFATSDGLRLLERRWQSPQPTRGEVAIVHGFTEHSGRYFAFAERLAAAGFNVAAFDLRGHGRSEGLRCLVRRFDEYLADLDLFIQLVDKRANGKPIWLFGHSLGGLIAVLWCITRQPKLAGLVLSGPALQVRSDLFPWLQRLADVGSLIVPRLRLTRMGSRFISRDPAVIEAFRNDPLVFHGRFPVCSGAEILRAGRIAMSLLERVRLPLLILHGTADRVADVAASQELDRRAESSDKTLRLYPGLYHEVLNEPERKQVLADVLAWLDERKERLAEQGE